MKNQKDILNQYFDQARQQPSLISPDQAATLLAQKQSLKKPREKRVQGIIGTAIVGSIVLALLFVITEKDTPSTLITAKTDLHPLAQLREEGNQTAQSQKQTPLTPSIAPKGKLHSPPLAGADSHRHPSTIQATIADSDPSQPITEATFDGDSENLTPDFSTEESHNNSNRAISKEDISRGYIQADVQLNALQETGINGAKGKVTITKLSSVNSYSDDYNPMITADGRTLYFVSDREHGFGGHDFWVSTKQSRDQLEFTPPSNLGSSINTSRSEGGATISADGQTMYFTACNRPDGLGDCDIYEARLEEIGWVEIRNVNEINTKDWESQPTISADGRSLFFVSNRPGALGGNEDSDIYISYKQADGTWSHPENLGAPVNTPKVEDSPFIVPAGNALYFSSAGHKGYGGLDFFVSELSEDSKWQTPANLGTGFNSPEDERFITITAAEDVMYFTKSVGKGNLDLYMAQKEAHSTSIIIKGSVLNSETKLPYNAELLFVDALSGRIISYANTNDLTEEFSLVLGKNTVQRSIDIYGYNDLLGEFRTRITIEPTNTYLEYRCDLFLNPSHSNQLLETTNLSATSRLSISSPGQGRTFRISAPEEGGELTILDAWGNILLREMMSEGEQKDFHLESAPEGLYLARIGKYSGVIHLMNNKETGTQ